MRSPRSVARIVLMSCALMLAVMWPGGAFAQGTGAPVRLDHEDFVWLDVVEEFATFEWTLDVRNDDVRPLRLRIILDLLDDDDNAKNRDPQGNPLDFVIVTVEPGQTMPISQQGSINYDVAAEVVTFSYRWEIISEPY